MRQDQIENLICSEVTAALEDMSEQALRNPMPELSLKIDGRALGLNAVDLSAAIQAVAGRVR